MSPGPAQEPSAELRLPPGAQAEVPVATQAPRKNSSTSATEHVLELNRAMSGIYAGGLRKLQQRILDTRPVIIARFSGAGGDMTLYRPGADPIEAAAPPVAYQYFKSCGHAAMALYPLTVPYLDQPDDKTWMAPMQGFLSKHRQALDALEDLEIEERDRSTLARILRANIAYMESCLQNRKVSLDDLKAFTANFRPPAMDAIQAASNIQVTHWMKVLDDWKKLLGDDWNDVLAATNSIYVTRQNNILFSVLVQYMGEEAINRRLFLFETTEFVTTKETMQSLLTRIVSDRPLGQLYFNDPYIMDYELMGSGARRAIAEQCRLRNMKPILPTMAPFNSTEWPWRTDPASGTGPATLEEIQ